MSDTPEPKPASPDTQAGVFGNLPDARPGTRSPRRKTGAGTKPKTASAAKSKPRTAAKPKPAAKPKAAPKSTPAASPRAEEPQRPEPTTRRPAADQQPGGIADVAWAGIAVAAEAATIGVRLASRAIEAVRGNPERD